MLLDTVITVVCNYKAYLQNSCSVKDDRRGVSVCLSTSLKPQKTTTREAWPHSPQQPFGKSRPSPPPNCCNRPQGPVWVSDCFLLYPCQLETNRWEQVPLSNPMGASLPRSRPPASLGTSSEQDVPSWFAIAPLRTPSPA